MDDKQIMTDPQALYDFARNVEYYMNELDTKIVSLQKEHYFMGSYWKDDQYKQMTEVVEEFKFEINKIKVDMDQLCQKVKEKALDLAEGSGVKVKV